jgi:hypothetical protein
MSRPILFIILGCLFLPWASYSQSIANQVIASSGQTVESGGLVLDYTVGETVTATLTGADFLLTQGFHQPYPDSSVSIFPFSDALNVLIFPVPFTGTLNLVGQGNIPGTRFEVALFDVSGRNVFTSSIDLREPQTFALHHLPAGTYLLSLGQGQHRITQQIIKIN